MIAANKQIVPFVPRQGEKTFNVEQGLIVLSTQGRVALNQTYNNKWVCYVSLSGSSEGYEMGITSKVCTSAEEAVNSCHQRLVKALGV